MTPREAFLAVLRDCEGTSLWPDPYLIIFGGRTSPYGYKDHPGNLGFHDWRHFKDPRTGKDNYSTASGAYQFIRATWNRLRKQVDLVDFSPPEQDRAAIELIHEQGALVDVDRENVMDAVRKVNDIWASLPGSPYGQKTKTVGYVLERYKEHREKA